MSVNKVIDRYLDGLSIPEVSLEIGIPKSTIYHQLKKANVLRSRTDGIKLAAENGKLGGGLRGKTRTFTDEWKLKISKSRSAWGLINAKGFTLKPSGYIEHTTKEHKGRFAHIVVMENHIGRKLLKHEVVHHIDENKQNNVIENLQLMTRAEHCSLHAKQNVLTRERNNYGQFK
jgi:hypothetical protein